MSTYHSYHTYYTTTTTLATASTLTTATTLTSLGSDHDMSGAGQYTMFYISFTSKDRRGEEVPLKARLVIRHLPLERTISRFPDFPISRQRSKKYPASYAQISVNTASQVTVRSHFPLRFFESTRIPHRILAKSLIPKIPFQASLCSELSRVTHIKKDKIKESLSL